MRLRPFGLHLQAEGWMVRSCLQVSNKEVCLTEKVKNQLSFASPISVGLLLIRQLIGQKKMQSAVAWMHLPLCWLPENIEHNSNFLSAFSTLPGDQLCSFWLKVDWSIWEGLCSLSEWVQMGMFQIRHSKAYAKPMFPQRKIQIPNLSKWTSPIEPPAPNRCSARVERVPWLRSGLSTPSQFHWQNGCIHPCKGVPEVLHSHQV